jgi:hypothetical protein
LSGREFALTLQTLTPVWSNLKPPSAKFWKNKTGLDTPSRRHKLTENEPVQKQFSMAIILY